MGLVTDTLKGIPMDAVLRERITVLDAAVNRLAEENVQLKTEKAKLFRKIDEITDELLKLKAAHHQFAEHRGAKFRRLPQGGYDEFVVYCLCSMPMVPLIPGFAGTRFAFRCPSCGYQTPFVVGSLPAVLAELKGKVAKNL